MRFPWRKDVCRRGRRSSGALCLRGIGARSRSRPADLRPRGALFAGEPAEGFEALHFDAPALRVVEVVPEVAMNH